MLYWIHFVRLVNELLAKPFSNIILVYCTLFCCSLPNSTVYDQLKEFALKIYILYAHQKKKYIMVQKKKYVMAQKKKYVISAGGRMVKLIIVQKHEITFTYIFRFLRDSAEIIFNDIFRFIRGQLNHFSMFALVFCTLLYCSNPSANDHLEELVLNSSYFVCILENEIRNAVCIFFNYLVEVQLKTIFSLKQEAISTHIFRFLLRMLNPFSKFVFVYCTFVYCPLQNPSKMIHKISSSLTAEKILALKKLRSPVSIFPSYVNALTLSRRASFIEFLVF